MRKKKKDTNQKKRRRKERERDMQRERDRETETERDREIEKCHREGQRVSEIHILKVNIANCKLMMPIYFVILI